MLKNLSKTHRPKLLSAFAVGFFLLAVFWLLPALSSQFGGHSTQEVLVSKVLHIESASAGTAAGAGVEAKARETAKNNIDPHPFKTIIATIIGAIALLFITVEGWIIMLEAEILMRLMSYNGFVVSPAVNIGWTLVRDIGNLFFVLILLVIALGTILHIESYNFKRLLPKVIIMAVLINFSRLICGLIIDFAQVIMMTFAAAFIAIAGEGDLMEVLKIKEIIFSAKQASEAVGEGNLPAGTDTSVKLWQVAASAIIAVILLLIAIIVILVILVVIMMRIVMLWLLVVLSPLAYIMSAFPQGQPYARQWWQEFSKYVIIGPVLAFFLWLTFAIASGQQGATNTTGELGLDPGELGLDPKEIGTKVEAGVGDEKNPGFFTAIGTADVMIQFIIAIGMLMGGLMITQQMGVAGSGLAGAVYGKIRQKGLDAVKLPFKIAAWANRKAGAGEIPGIGRFTKGWSLNPVDLYGGFKEGMGRRRIIQETTRKAAAGAKFREDIRASRPKRLLGIMRLMAGSPADATEAFGSPGRFIKGAVIGALWKGQTTKELDEKGKEWEKTQDEINDMERVTQSKSADEYGKEGLARSTGIGMEQRLLTADKSRLMMFLDEKGLFGKAGELNSATDDDLQARLLAEVDRNQLRALGITDEDMVAGVLTGEDEKFKGGKGLTPGSAEAQRFLNAFAVDQGSKLVGHGIYYDNAGIRGDVTAKVTEDAGKKYMEDQEKAANKDVKVVVAGGISNGQLVNRQRSLEDVNRQMLKVLREISHRKDQKASVGEQHDLANLTAEGKKLGGQTQQYMGRKGGQWEFFGSTIDPNSTVDKLDQKRITGAAARNKEEEKEVEAIKNARSRDANFWKEAQRIETLGPTGREAEMAKITADKGKKEQALAQEKKNVWVPPVPYYAMEALRALQREEISKLPDELDSDEGIQMMKQSESDGNDTRFTALMKKMAKDGNDNEWLKAWGKTTNFQGMKEFGEDVLVKKFKMNRQQMLQVMSDIGFVNEEIGHFSTARLVEIKNGVYKWNKESTQASIVAHELTKKDSRSLLQRTNRLGYGGEDPTTGKFKLSLSGKLILSNLQDQVSYRIARGEFNPSALSKIAEDVDSLQEMVKGGLIKQSVVDAIVTAAKKQGISANFSNFQSTADRFAAPGERSFD